MGIITAHDTSGSILSLTKCRVVPLAVLTAMKQYPKWRKNIKTMVPYYQSNTFEDEADKAGPTYLLLKVKIPVSIHHTIPVPLGSGRYNDYQRKRG